MIHLLVDPTKQLPAQLVNTAKTLYERRFQNVRILVPILVGLSKEEVITVLPKLVMLKPQILKPGNEEDG